MRLAEPIETERLRLRTLAPEHAAGPYACWARDPETIRFLEVRHRPHDAAALAEYISRKNESPDNLLLGIFLKGENRHIGNIKLGPINPIHRRALIGLVIGEKQEWGKGYAAEAIRAVAEHAFQRLGLHRVEAGCYAANRSSLRAFEKAGFGIEARLAQYWRLDDGWDDQVWLARINAE